MDEAASAVHRRRTSPTPGLTDWRRMPSKQNSQFSAIEIGAILFDPHLGQIHFPNTYFIGPSLSADIRGGLSIGGWNPDNCPSEGIGSSSVSRSRQTTRLGACAAGRATCASRS